MDKYSDQNNINYVVDPKNTSFTTGFNIIDRKASNSTKSTAIGGMQVHNSMDMVQNKSNYFQEEGWGSKDFSLFRKTVSGCNYKQKSISLKQQQQLQQEKQSIINQGGNNSPQQHKQRKKSPVRISLNNSSQTKHVVNYIKQNKVMKQKVSKNNLNECQTKHTKKPSSTPYIDKALRIIEIQEKLEQINRGDEDSANINNNNMTNNNREDENNSSRYHHNPHQDNVTTTNNNSNKRYGKNVFRYPTFQMQQNSISFKENHDHEKSRRMIQQFTRNLMLMKGEGSGKNSLGININNGLIYLNKKSPSSNYQRLADEEAIPAFISLDGGFGDHVMRYHHIDARIKHKWMPQKVYKHYIIQLENENNPELQDPKQKEKDEKNMSFLEQLKTKRLKHKLQKQQIEAEMQQRCERTVDIVSANSIEEQQKQFFHLQQQQKKQRSMIKKNSNAINSSFVIVDQQEGNNEQHSLSVQVEGGQQQQ